MRAKTGDVVLIDESLVYKTMNRRYKAIVLWEGINNQPLLTEVGRYRPHWGTYESIAEIIGHIDLQQAVKWE